jgi:hypothetical protein
MPKKEKTIQIKDTTRKPSLLCMLRSIFGVASIPKTPNTQVTVDAIKRYLKLGSE